MVRMLSVPDLLMYFLMFYQFVSLWDLTDALGRCCIYVWCDFHVYMFRVKVFNIFIFLYVCLTFIS